MFVLLVADGWCWFVLREKYCWLIAGGWFVLREKYCWLVADKPSEQGLLRQSSKKCSALQAIFHDISVLSRILHCFFKKN
jgi:hypothetical protein